MVPEKDSVSDVLSRRTSREQKCLVTWQRHVRVHVTDRHNKGMQAVAVSLGVELSQDDGVVGGFPNCKGKVRRSERSKVMAQNSSEAFREPGSTPT